MNSKQSRTLEVIDAEIAKLKAERATVFSTIRAASKSSMHDEVPLGKTGRLVTLDGFEIVGTSEETCGTHKVRSATRREDGSLELHPTFESIEWGDAETTLDENGEVEYVTVDGSIVPESQVKLV